MFYNSIVYDSLSNDLETAAHSVLKSCSFIFSVFSGSRTEFLDTKALCQLGYRAAAGLLFSAHIMVWR